MRRIAVFYDGSFFDNMNRYYLYSHTRHQPIDLKGFHEYIRYKVAHYETSDNVSLCQIVESHFFRGRFSLESVQALDDPTKRLVLDRRLDQNLMYAGIVTHYYPMNEYVDPPEEKGIDVWLALEAYDLAIHKGFDVLVLIAGDQDFVPLVRKINSLGTRVMVIGVDFSVNSGSGRFVQKTSQRLLEESSYVAMIGEDVDDDPEGANSVINSIFYDRGERERDR
jgi:uncharacterized LabA/DUF88 family protein